MEQARQQGAHQGPQQYGTTFAHLSHPQQYQQAYHDPAYRYRERTRVPLPQAPAWLPVAVFGVGVVAALLATFDRPGIGLVITGVVAGLTAFAALMVRPAVPGSGAEDEEARSGEPGSGEASGTEGSPGAHVTGGSGGPGPVAESGPVGDGGEPRPENPSGAAEHAEEVGSASGVENAVSETTGAHEDSGANPSAEAGGTSEAAEGSESDSSGTRTPGSVTSGDTGGAPEADGGSASSTSEAAEPPGSEDTRTASVPESTEPVASDGTTGNEEATEATGTDEATRTGPISAGETTEATEAAPAVAPSPLSLSHPTAAHATAPAPQSASAPRSTSAPAPASTPDRRSYTWSAVYGVLAAVLLFTAVFRDAGWVLFWTLTASFLLASMAFAARNPASRQGAVGVLTGSLALFRNLPSTPRFLTAPLQGKRFRRLAGPVLVTTVATVGLLLVFGLLFAFADPVFGSYLSRMFADLLLESDLNPFGDLFAMAMAVLLTGSAVLTARRRHTPMPAPRTAPVGPSPERTPLPVWVWTIPLSALVLLFTAFLAVQAVAMFGGDEYVQRVAGVTYAEYARQGFFQLVVVSLLVLCVIAVVVRVLPSSTTRVLRNALLGLLCTLTLVILASAMMRLQLYIDTYGLTRMRASAEAWIMWSAGVFGLLLVAGALNTLGRSAAWLPRATAALAGAALAVFAYGNPDLRIAESHQDLDLTTVDTWYLRDLSADAIPGLIELEGNDRDCALVGFQNLVEESDDTGFASWNLSRHRGLQQLDELGLFEIGGQAGMSCSYERGH
ncbi:DUF4153 domain-containing protein [Nocardiopsis deserti]|uniref:DUF4153 domain-containing protein n=1 Tax=Nocardiopsis deserti TaxID=2605988 RepID=UPI001CC25F13|nr:DUF4153 domain-containing protein [Nocardiopsis deserti]